MLRVSSSNSLSSRLQNLVKHLPEQEQLNALAKYKNEYANLSEPEQFGVVVSILGVVAGCFRVSKRCYLHTN